tara:strand:+ start:322 stop:1068 length:747 start_codon:yes stop_codon:yes gene_type:complete
MDVRALLADDAPGLGQVSRLSMKDSIADKLATLIGSGVLSIGDELPGERELAAALSVSRETVRGALLILSTRGIVSIIQGARTTVASCEVGDLAVAAARYRNVAQYGLKDVHEARLLVEARVARAATERIDAQTLDLLRASIEAQQACVSDPVRYLICDREFHTSIYRSCGNALLADMAADLYSYLLDYRRRAVALAGSIAVSIADHRAILAGLEQRDADAVICAFKIHETRIYETTRDLLLREPGTA